MTSELHICKYFCTIVREVVGLGRIPIFGKKYFLSKNLDSDRKFPYSF